MANQHFQQRQEHRYNQDEEGDCHNHTLRRSTTFYDLFVEVMDERLLEMHDWETMFPENRHEQGQLSELDSTAAMEQPVLVQEDVGQ